MKFNKNVEFMLIDLKNYINHAREHGYDIEIEDEAVTKLDQIAFEAELKLVDFERSNELAEMIADTIVSLVGRVSPKPGSIAQYKNMFQKKMFFQICIIDKAEDLLRQIQELKSDETAQLFRGMSESKYMMYSSFQRFWNENKLFERNLEYDKAVKDIVIAARNDITLKKYFQSFNSTISDISVLSFIQHVGSNTPLLDWTYNIDIALYFAIGHGSPHTHSNSALDNYLSVYFIPESLLRAFNYRQDVSEIIESQFSNFLAQDGWDEEKFQFIDKKHSIKDYIKKRAYNILLNEFGKLDNLFELSSICFFADKDVLEVSNQHLINSLNIINQKGGFLWNFHSFAPVEFVIKKIHRPHVHPTLPTNIKCLDINKKLIPVIQEYLNSVCVDESFVYPDPKGIVNRIVNKVVLGKQNKGENN